MKLIIQDGCIAATATDEYAGPDDYMPAPDGFDETRMADYEVLDGQLVMRVVVPAEVSMGQCRLALFDIHKIKTEQEFLALTDLLPEDQRARARIELSTRPTVRFDNPLVQGVCEAKGWSAAELFIYAAAQ